MDSVGAEQLRELLIWMHDELRRRSAGGTGARAKQTSGAESKQDRAGERAPAPAPASRGRAGLGVAHPVNAPRTFGLGGRACVRRVVAA